MTPTSRARYDQPFATAGGGGPPRLVTIGTDHSHFHAAYVTPGQITELPAGTTATTTAGSPVVKIEGPKGGAKGDLDLTTLGLRRGDPIAVGNGAGDYASPLAAASYAHAIVASVDSAEELTCFRPFDVSVATDALAIGRGDSYHEARFNDNNLVDIQGARSVYSAGHAFAFDGLFGASASDLWCDYGPFSAIRVGGAVLGDTVVGARIARVYVEGSAGVLSYASGHVLTLGEVLGLEVTGSLDVGVPVPFVFHAGGYLPDNGGYVVAEDYSTGSYSCASGIRRIGRAYYVSDIPVPPSAIVRLGRTPDRFLFAAGDDGGNDEWPQRTPPPQPPQPALFYEAPEGASVNEPLDVRWIPIVGPIADPALPQEVRVVRTPVYFDTVENKLGFRIRVRNYGTGPVWGYVAW